MPHELLNDPDEVDEAEEAEMVKDLEAKRHDIYLSPEAAEDIRRSIANPQPPTEKMRKMIAAYQEYAKNNPGW